MGPQFKINTTRIQILIFHCVVDLICPSALFFFFFLFFSRNMEESNKKPEAVLISPGAFYERPGVVLCFWGVGSKG